MHQRQVHKWANPAWLATAIPDWAHLFYCWDVWLVQCSAKEFLRRFRCTTDGSRYMKRIQAIDEHMHMELEQLDGTERCSLSCA
jgi:hypothetical protein